MAKIPVQTTAPISWQTPIVKPDGTMTEPMRRLIQALTGNGTSVLDPVQALIDAELQEGVGINILPDGHLLSDPTISADVQEILDEISNTRGVVLYRGASGWAALAPGTANFFLQTHGAAADPTWAAATANIQTLLDSISSTQGVILYRSASAWVALAPGTSGNFLQTLGAGANPAWAASPTIQALLDGISSTRGVVLYRGASGWAALAPGTSGNIFQTNGAGADPSWVAPSVANIQTLLDGISSTQGTVLYRSASAWTALAPGTSGQFLQTLGAGANPLWAAAGGAGGGAAWTALTPVSPSGVANVDFTGLGSYNELLIVARLLTSTVSGVRAIQVSTNNGVSFDTTAANYLIVASATGVESNAATPAIAYNSTNSTAARTLIARISNLKGPVKSAQAVGNDPNLMYVGSASDINAIRILNHTGGNISGGPIQVYAR